MRILWIEDNDEVSQDSINKWFGYFENEHSIKRFKSFGESYHYIDSNLSDFDLVILDINLEKGADVNTADFLHIVFPEDKSFLKEAGFHLYLQLLYKGFPTNRIIFLTSNTNNADNQQRLSLVTQLENAYEKEDGKSIEAILEKIEKIWNTTSDADFFKTLIEENSFDYVLNELKEWATPEAIDGELPNENTYNELENRFKEARLRLPLAIEKGKYCGYFLQKWLAQHCSKTNENQDIFDYLTLRRGILDIIQLIENNQEIILQSKFENILDKTSFLEGLKWQVRDFKLAINPHKSVYFAICDYVSKPFETFTFNWKKDVPPFGEQPETISLYFLRNWTAHGLIFGSEKTVLNAQITGLAFLWAMKSIFDIEEYGHQNELKRLFSLKNTKSFNLLSDYNVTSEKDALEKINTRGRKLTKDKKGNPIGNPNWQQENYVSHCYASYLLASDSNPSTLKKLTESVYEVI
jgi:hypothetical protein